MFYYLSKDLFEKMTGSKAPSKKQIANTPIKTKTIINIHDDDNDEDDNNIDDDIDDTIDTIDDNNVANKRSIKRSLSWSGQFPDEVFQQAEENESLELLSEKKNALKIHLSLIHI